MFRVQNWWSASAARLQPRVSMTLKNLGHYLKYWGEGPIFKGERAWNTHGVGQGKRTRAPPAGQSEGTPENSSDAAVSDRLETAPNFRQGLGKGGISSLRAACLEFPAARKNGSTAYLGPEETPGTAGFLCGPNASLKAPLWLRGSRNRFRLVHGAELLLLLADLLIRQISIQRISNPAAHPASCKIQILGHRGILYYYDSEAAPSPPTGYNSQDLVPRGI